MARRRAYRTISLLLLLLVGPAAAQPFNIVFFDEDTDASTPYYDPSRGLAASGDYLNTADGNLPLNPSQAYSGTVSGELAYRHDDGSWEMVIQTERAVDLIRFDSLSVWINGPESISGRELPRVALEDEDGVRTEAQSLSAPTDVRIDSVGFTHSSSTNALLTVRYVDALPRNSRRPGYPEDLTIRFHDSPADTSEAAIGLPAVPAHFVIESASGFRAPFRFRDIDEDGTISRHDEYVEVLLPEAEDSDRLRAAWRIELAPTQSPGALDPPGAGDVFRLKLIFDEITLDADPATWQRVSLPLASMIETGGFDMRAARAVVLASGGRNEDVRTLWFDRIEAIRNDDDAFLDMLQQTAFDYFWSEANPNNGLVKDRSTAGSPSSIAATGFGLSAITVGIDHGWIAREQGRERVLNTLEFLWHAPQSTAVDAAGYKGFFYHFLNMQTGRRMWESELSTIDTALLMGGVLHVREYFSQDEAVRALADSIYQRVDWAWMQYRHPDNPTAALSHGWYPDPAGRSNAGANGFIVHDWIGYNEAMILYILALGSPTHPAGPDAWNAWTSGYDWETHYGYSFVAFPPLFGHQYSHVWIDFRGRRDAYMRARALDYFENSRRATLAQRAYHAENPAGWPNYGKDEWGLTASDVPGGYSARGAPPARNDDGTIAPTAPGGSIAFTPEASIAALRTMYRKYPELWGPYGFRDAYNVSEDWVADDYLGIDQGPILLMAENHRTGSVWSVFMQNDAVRAGLAEAGFEADWVGSESAPKRSELILEGSFPNPSTGMTTISFELSHTEHVVLEVFDVLGRSVAVPVDGMLSQGRHSVRFDGRACAPGIYLYVVRHGGAMRSGSMLLVR